MGRGGISHLSDFYRLDGDMMAILYGFFDSEDKDRLYSAEDLTNYFLRLMPNGVTEGSLKVTAGAGFTASVSTGWGYLLTRWVHITEVETLTFAAAETVRQDRVVLRLNTSDAVRNISLEVKQGTENDPPALTRNIQIFEISLARVIVGTTKILAVVDEREDISVCGIVQGFAAFDGMRFKQLTRAQYDTLENYSNRALYVVAETNGDITAYIGTSRLGGYGVSGAAMPASLYLNGVNGTIGNAEREDI